LGRRRGRGIGTRRVVTRNRGREPRRAREIGGGVDCGGGQSHERVKPRERMVLLPNFFSTSYFLVVLGSYPCVATGKANFHYLFHFQKYLYINLHFQKIFIIDIVMKACIPLKLKYKSCELKMTSN
jgi:hypothetical protein